MKIWLWGLALNTLAAALNLTIYASDGALANAVVGSINLALATGVGLWLLLRRRRAA